MLNYLNTSKIDNFLTVYAQNCKLDPIKSNHLYWYNSKGEHREYSLIMEQVENRK